MFRLKMKLFFFSLLVVGASSCNQPYEPKSSPCSKEEVKVLQDMEPHSSIYFIPEDVPKVIMTSLKDRGALSSSDEQDLLNKMYTEHQKRCWLDRPAMLKDFGNNITFKIDINDRKHRGSIFFGEGDSLMTMENLNSIKAHLQLGKDCEQETLVALYKALRGIEDKDIYKILPLMKLGYRTLYACYSLVDEKEEEVLVKLPVGYALHYGPW